MSTYYLPDATGTDPKYRKQNIPFCVYTKGMVITFPASPIFADSLVLTANDGLNTALSFTYQPEDISSRGMSDAYLANPNFSKTLIDRITITSDVPVGTKITAAYQEFYRTNPGDYFNDGTPFQVSDDLIKWLVSSVSSLKQQFGGVTASIATSTAEPLLLPEDINEELDSNKITDEVHQVNTATGIKFIRPRCGPFFRDSVVLKDGDTLLVEGTDYQVASFDKNLTRRSRNVSGIYRYIMLTAPVSGSVTLSYHPVGGITTIDDANALWDRLSGITDFLNSMSFLTTDTLLDTPVVRQQNNAIEEVMTDMRRLLANPQYVDATGGTSVQKAFVATDSEFHWYTIATLFKVQNNDTVITADAFHGRIFFPINNVSCEFTLDVNLNTPHKIASFTTQSLVVDPRYVLFGDVSVATAVYPLFRLLRSTAGKGQSGLVLQVGIAFPTLSDNPVIEDLSSLESGWLLDKNNIIVDGQPLPKNTTPMDTGITLPDGVTVWGSVADGTSEAIVFAPDLPEGYLVYVGAGVLLNTFDSTATTPWVIPSSLPAYIPLSVMESVRVVLSYADTSTVVVDIPLSGRTGTLKSGVSPIVIADGQVSTIKASVDASSGTPVISLSVGSAIDKGNQTQVSYVMIGV